MARPPRCHPVAVGQTRCSSHQECALPDTECGFVDAYLQPSFGNVLCGSCTNRPTCLVSTGGVGRCVCMLRPVTTQACAVPGQRLTPNPGQVCLVSLGGGGSSASYTATWSGLVSAQCLMLNQAQIFCLTVFDGDVSMRLAVGMAILGGGRRLLGAGGVELNASEWRMAAEPCRSLMGETIMGPVDRYTASECHRWRDIGERAVVQFNLTRIEPVLFTSWTLMVERLAGDPEAAVQMARVAPRLGGFLLSYQSWFQPVVVLGLRYWGMVNRSSPLFRTVFAKAAALNTTTANAVVELMAKPFVRRAKARRVLRGLMENATASASRRLLQNSWKDNLAAVQDYTVEIVKGSIDAGLSVDFAAQWAQGPFVWPPNYDYKTDQSCLVASLLFNYTLFTFKSTAAYYTGHDAPPRPEVSRSFVQCLPVFPKNVSFPLPSGVGPTAAFFKWLTSFVDRDRVLTYLSRPEGGDGSPFSQDIKLLFTCDFNAVQHCTRFTRDLAWGVVIVVLALGVLSLVLKAVGVPLADPFLFLVFLPFVSVFVFGVSPMCMPLVPTCLTDELLHLAEYFLPSSIAVPSALRVSPTCVETAGCFRSCTDAPFAFKSALDNVAWISLRVGFAIPDIEWPAAVSEWVTAGVNALGMDAFAFGDVYRTKRAYLDWDDMQLAQDICCGLTLFNLLPFVIGLIVVILLLGCVAALATGAAEIALALVLDAILYTHTR